MNPIYLTRNFIFLLLVVQLYFNNSIAQQYPKVPADLPAYLQEMKTIAAADVYSRSDWNYVISGGTVTTAKYKQRVIKYDKLGRIIEIMNISSKGENLSVIIFKYDSRNLPHQETEFLPTGEMLGRTKYTYDPKGRLKDITWLNSFEFIINRKAFDIDESKGLVTEWQYYSPDSVTSKTEYYYSNPENGILLKQNEFIGADLINKSISYIRDSVQTIIKEEVRDAGHRLVCYYDYTYNKNSKLQQITAVFPGEKKIPRLIYDYEEDGLLSGKIEYNQKGEIIDYKKYTYE